VTVISKRGGSQNLHQTKSERIATMTAQTKILKDASESAASPTIAQADIAALAYELWQDRGCPIGSPEEDWFRAQERLSAAAVETA
jgi:hypothetical protein